MFVAQGYAFFFLLIYGFLLLHDTVALHGWSDYVFFGVLTAVACRPMTAAGDLGLGSDGIGIWVGLDGVHGMGFCCGPAYARDVCMQMVRARH
jgi:hypothetical protein